MKRRIAKIAHDAVVLTVARLRPRPKLPERGVRMNVGSGVAVAPGWVNLDAGVAAMVAPLPGFVHRLVWRLMPDTSATRDAGPDAFSRTLRDHCFVHWDLRRGLPVPDGACGAIYCAHVLEHLEPTAGSALLAECRRALADGGVLRVAVPDLAHAMRLYRAGDADRALGYFFVGADASTLTQHRWMYDEATLADALRSAGFATVHRRAFREGECPDLEALDARADETLFMEAHR